MHRSPFFFSNKGEKMFALTIFASIIASLFLIWALWFIVSLIHYIRSGQYQIDQRLRDVCK